MGMQCTFSYSDLQDAVTVMTTEHEDGTSTAKAVETGYVFWLHIPEGRQADQYFCWFDCGSATEDQLSTIQFLIRNRIPFTCA